MFRQLFAILSFLRLPGLFGGNKLPVNNLLVGKILPIFPGKGIVNNGMPECRNCKHFMPHDSEAHKYNLATCLLYGEKNVISGKIRFEYAEHVRNREKQCSKLGVNFEPIVPLIEAPKN